MVLKCKFFKVLFSVVREPTEKCLCLYDLIFKTSTTLQVSIELSFSNLLTRSYIGQNYGGEKYCRMPSNFCLKWYLRNLHTINFRTPKCAKNGLFCALLIFAHSCCAKSVFATITSVSESINFLEII